MLALKDSRRLKGPNLLTDRTGAVIEVSVSGFSVEKVINTWASYARYLLDGVGWRDEKIVTRTFLQGADLGITAPFGVLHSASRLNEAAWSATVASLNQVHSDDHADRIPIPSETRPAQDDIELTNQIATLKRLIAEERNPDLIVLKDQAEQQQVSIYPDQKEVSIGSGKGSKTWPIHQLPAPDEVSWEDVYDVPAALVTGTNGKSTTVRLAATIMGAAGIRAGVHATEGVYVVGEDLEKREKEETSDVYALLRNTGVDVVLSEVSRRNIIRRGLPIARADVAIITNVAADHLGECGVSTLEDLTAVHFIVHRALKDGGILILNADDPYIVRYAEALDAKICWFSLHPENPLVVQQIARGGSGCYVKDHSITCASKHGREAILSINDIPITLGGTARHDVSNSLAAVCLAKILGVPTAAIVDGLVHFQGDASDNPGRGNYFDLNGVKVLLDYAHNAHGLSAVVNTIIRMPAKRRLVLFDQESDHPEEEIRRLARMAWSMQPDKFIISSQRQGTLHKSSGEVPAVIHNELKCLGTADERIELVGTSLEGVQRAVMWAEEGDFLLLLAHSEPGRVLDYLQAHQKKTLPS